MANVPSPTQPSLPWRTGSSIVMGVTGLFTRTFLLGANSTQTHGLDRFMELLEKRRVIEDRERGLLTISNHTCVLDDPLIWGVLPFGFHFSPNNHRWSLGSYDILFKNKLYSMFFAFGQVLPTHRNAHSIHGGLFQPTMTQAVRLLSGPPYTYYGTSAVASTKADASISSPDLVDPFSEPHLTYSTTGTDTFPAPSAYFSRKHSWIHIFPEGRVHQHPRKTMRYFKWGVARLILEPDTCPDIVPLWIEGNQDIMHEARQWPRWIPRAGKEVGIWFGENVGGEVDGVFTELRRKWQKLVEEELSKERLKSGLDVGELSEDLKYGKAATELRTECTRRVREEVLKVRRLRGLPDEDPKAGLVETWREEGGRREGKMDDDSWTKDM